MDLAEMAKDIADLRTLVAGMQTDIEWLTRLVWGMVSLNVGSFLLNAFALRNNRSKGKDKE